MTQTRYVIAQRGRQLALVHGRFDETTDIGDTFDRKPSTKTERWLVVKVFDESDQETLSAIEHLMGPLMHELFNIKTIRV